jgi:AcrR family transcriptional regulator
MTSSQPAPAPSPRTAIGAEDAKPLRADALRNRARILEAAEAVFSEQGTAGSTEEVASRAGVAIGTVFRHFPTKTDLLGAIMKELLQRLTDEVRALNAGGDPATGLFTFFTEMVAQAAAKKTVVDLLARAGIGVQVGGSVQALQQAIHALLIRAQAAGAVRDDVQLDEVMALLIGACQGALYAGWDADLQRRTLTILFAGLRPVAGGR